MFEKLSAVENRYEQIGVELTRPDVASNNALFTKLMKEHSELTPIVEKYREYCAAVSAEKEALEMLEAGGLDKDFKELLFSLIPITSSNVSYGFPVILKSKSLGLKSPKKQTVKA